MSGSDLVAIISFEDEKVIAEDPVGYTRSASASATSLESVVAAF